MALPQFSLIERIAIPIPEIDPPAIKPDDRRTPGELPSASVAVCLVFEFLSSKPADHATKENRRG